ncbi:MAG TPA: DNA polymerase III subunit alpha [Clostridia bacterium]|jgi:DNA polymerase-3 subunit alpha|nr:DNA polymerase III subunit alpha [Clostridia bacterium]
MNKANFIHLHVHTEYSILDGAAPISRLVETAAKMGMEAIAMTDHGGMYGAIKFYEKCKEKNINPIIGCEVYITENRFSREIESRWDKSPSHLVLLAKNNIGYKNLSHLSSLGFTEGFFYKPRIDLEILRKYSEGLICLSACISGTIPRLLLSGDYKGAKEHAKELKDIFGDDFYIELQDHGLLDEKQANKLLYQLAQELNIKCVATNDMHYINKDDADMHDVLLCIQTGTTIDDPDRMRFPNSEFYMKTPEEMQKLFSWCPEAITNTLEIARKCNVTFAFREYQIPDYICPDGLSSADYLTKLTMDGLKRRYGKNITEEHYERANTELSTIISLGFADYYLIVWDFIFWARQHDIPVGPGRGSGVGSIVAYAIGITNVDPIKYNLLFERFLNKDRVSMPDFDIDFCFDRRDEVVEYTKQKYGEDHISQIITFGTMQKKAAILDVGRVYNVPYDERAKITKEIPFFGANDKKVKINDLLNPASEYAQHALIEQYKSNETYKKILDIAIKIEGMPRNTSVHPAGVVIYKYPALDTIPLAISKDKNVTTQFEMGEVERLGLLKMDFLALMTLTDIKRAHDLVLQRTGNDINFDELGYDDPNVYEMIGRGDTDAVFQLEGGGMKSFMSDFKPKNLEDIIAGISIYRPGPMDNKDVFLKNRANPENIQYKHPALASILDVTSGIMIYQEQAMMVARKLAGYTMTQADNLRAIFSKKKVDKLPAEKEKFIYGLRDKNGNYILDAEGNPVVKGCIANGISEKTAEEIFDDMKSFAHYAFNKSHAAAYAVLSYITAYYKYYYPVEFMAAVVNDRMDKPDDIKKYMAVLKNMQIKVLPPDINKSSTNFTTEGANIRYGLGCIKNIGKVAVEDYVISERNKNGPFTSFYDFVSRVDSRFLNKKFLESLIFAGAFDCFEQNRATLMSNYKLLLDRIIEDKKAHESGQVSMFSILGLNTEKSFEYLDQKEYNTKYKLTKEKEMLKMYLTGHPLAELEDRFMTYTFNTSMVPKPTEGGESEDNVSADDNDDEFSTESNASQAPAENVLVTFGGIVTSVNRRQTKTKQNMAVVVIEDYYDQIEVLFFNRTYEKAKELLVEDNIIEITGRFSMKEGNPIIYAQSASPIIYESKSESTLPTKKIADQALCFLLTQETQEKYDQIEKMLSRISGPYPVYIQFDSLMYNTGIKVNDLDEARIMIGNVLGPHNVILGNFNK